MVWRCVLIGLFLCGSAVAQGYPKLERALEREPGAPAVVVVVVAPEREPFVRVVGLGAEAQLPLGDLTRVLVMRATLAAAAREGWNLDEPLAASGVDALRRAEEPLSGWTWADVLGAEAEGCIGSFRFLAAGERGRSAVQVVAEHGFAGSRQSWYSHLPWAALQAAVEARTGWEFGPWLESTLAEEGMRGVRVRGETVPLKRRDGDGWIEDGAHPVAEVAAAFGASATAADLATLLTWLVAAPADRTAGFTARGLWPREIEASGYASSRFGARSELRVLPAERTAWFLWAADAGDDAVDALEAAILEDVFGPRTEEEEAQWNSAVGVGGRYGGRFAPERRVLPTGRYRIEVSPLGRALTIDLELTGDPSSVRLVGTDRFGVVGVSADDVGGKILLGDGQRLEIDLSVRGGVLEGVVALAGARMFLPYAVRAETRPADAETEPVPPNVPSLQRPFSAAMRTVQAELDALFEDATTGRVVAVGRVDGAVWDGAWGFADPAAGTPLRRGSRVPLGAVTRELFDEAFIFLMATGRLDGEESLVDLRGGAETPYDPRLARLAPVQLSMGVAPAPDYFRLVREPADARDLDEVLRAHGFFLSRDDEPDGDSALPRALLLEALERGGVLADWSSFVAFDLAGWLGMPGLLDVSDAARDRAAIRLRGPDGVLRPARVAEVACDGNAWATGADVARWLVGLVPEADDWTWDEKRVEWDAHVGGARGLDAFSRSGDQDEMTSRLILLPELGLGVFVWGADGERNWISPAVEAVLGAFWAVGSRDRPPTWLNHELVVGPYWSDEDEAEPGQAMVGAPRSFAAAVQGLGPVEVRIGAEPNTVDVRLDGQTLEVREALTVRRALSATCELPAEVAPDGAGGGRLVILARLRSSGLRGVLALEADGRYRLPFELELAPAEGR